MKMDLTGCCAILRIEKTGRGGKTVTVIDRLPKHGTFVSELCRRLKSRCGSGGTFYMTSEGGVIELQGDQRERVRDLLAKEGIRNKG